MKFILVQCTPDASIWDMPQWRATHVKADGNAIDMLFYRDTIDQARACVRAAFPGATFSDQEPFNDV